MRVYDYMGLKAYDEINALETAKRKAEKKGMEKGIELRNIEIAKNLLDVLDDDIISLKTGLSIKLIKNLR